MAQKFMGANTKFQLQLFLVGRDEMQVGRVNYRSMAEQLDLLHECNKPYQPLLPFHFLTRFLSDRLLHYHSPLC